jgi:Recombination endonuclease VII
VASSALVVVEKTMSIELWEKLPRRFLKMNYKTWIKLDHDVKRLVVELANSQRFKCALCLETHGLVIEHDHYPEEGPGHPYTLYNIRGLVCQRCNWHLMVYEKEESGEYLGWDNVSSDIQAVAYEDYSYAYECRVSPLLEALLEERMGSRNYWRRRHHLQKFDEWRYEGRYSARRERWMEREAISTPEQFIKVLISCMQFVIKHYKNDPNYQPPEKFIEVIGRVRPIIEKAIASRSATAADSASGLPLAR